MDFYNEREDKWRDHMEYNSGSPIYLCNLMRFCFESDNLEEVIKAFNYLRSCEDMTSEIQLPMVLIRKRFSLSGFEYMCLMLALASALEGKGSPTFFEAAEHYPFFQNAEVFASLVENICLIQKKGADCRGIFK